MKWPIVEVETIKASERNALVGGPFGSDLTSKSYVEDGVPVIRGNNLPDHSAFHDGDFVFVSDEKALSLTANTAGPRDLVFTQRGTLGQVGLIPDLPNYPRYVISQSQMKLTVDASKAEPRFVYYYFRLPTTVETIKSHVSSSGVPHINLGVLRRFKIPLPPLKDQRRIVEVAAAYDDLIENNRRRMALLEESARLLYREWFVHLRFPGHEHTRLINGVPQGWERLKALEAMHVMSGGTPKTSVASYWNGEIPFYTPKDAASGAWVTDCERSVTEEGAANCNSRIYPKGTVFISARGTVGKLNLSQRPMVMSQSCYALAGKGNLSQGLLYFAMGHAVEELKQHAVGAVFNAIVVDTFNRIHLLVPSREVAGQFEDFATPILAQLEALTLQNQKLRTARDLLLPRLMSGEIGL